MEKVKNSLLWTEEGYNIFAKKGLDGIQVERLARILHLNKSGFYHYFGDLEGYCVELIKMHEKKVNIFLGSINQLKKIDPDYLLLLIEHTPTMMFQVQLTRHKEIHSFYQASEKVDHLVNIAVRSLWNEFLGINDSPDLAMRYFYIVRDMFYTRISFQNLNYQFLHNFVTEAKSVIDQIAERKSLEPTNSLR
jgi:Bacterial regulatory proteins, tetR family